MPGGHCSHRQLRAHGRSLGGPAEKGEMELVLQAPCHPPMLPPGLGTSPRESAAKAPACLGWGALPGVGGSSVF